MPTRRAPMARWWPAVLAAALLYGWWATGLRPFSGGAALAVVGAGVVAMVVGRIERTAPAGAPPSEATTERSGRPPAGGGVVGWAALLSAGVAWQLVAYSQGPRSDHPTLSSLTNAVLDSQVARTAAFVAWLAVAARMARR